MAEPLSDDDLISILRKEEQASANEQDKLSDLRDKSLKYYDREPYGDEQDGASKVVTSEHADAIESIMPGMIEVFTSGDKTVNFAPQSAGDEQYLDEIEEYITHCVMVENKGFTILHTLIKDALMYRLGGVSVDLEDKEETRSKQVQGLSQDVIDILKAETAKQGAEVVLELTPDAPQQTDIVPATGEPLPAVVTYSGTITITKSRKKAVIENIAPEDIRFTPTARDQDDASFLGFRKKVTAGELVKMGLSQEEVDNLRSDKVLSIEDEQRNDGDIEGSNNRDTVGDSERPLWLVLAYVRADVNGDGISETLRVLYAHAGGLASEILEKDEWDDLPAIALASPILMPHTIVGRSLFDQTEDLQLISSVLTRGMLDNLYMANRPRPAVSDSVILDSLLDWVPGSPIRFKAGAKPGDGHIDWQKVPSVMGDALTALEYIQTVKENRTGTSRHNQGLDADSLNKTKGGMQMLMSAAQQRQKLIARVLGQSIARIYRLVYQAIKRGASEQPVQYWTGNSFKTANPSKWPDDIDLTVNVGLGTGNTQQELEHLNFVAQIQEKFVALQGGTDGPFVTAENLANTAQKITEKLGFPAPGLFFQPAEAVKQQVEAKRGQPKPPPPEVQAEQMKAQAAMQIEQAKAQSALQTEQAKTQGSIETQKAQLIGDMQKLEAEAARDAQKGQADALLAAAEMQIKQQELEIKREELAIKRMELANKQREMEINASAQSEEFGLKREELGAKVQGEREGRSHERQMARMGTEQGSVDSVADSEPDHGMGLAAALKESVAAQREVAQSAAQATQEMAQAIHALAQAHLSDTEVTTASGKTLRARKVPRDVN